MKTAFFIKLITALLSFQMLIAAEPPSQFTPHFNKILDDKARAEYYETISWMYRLSPQMMKRKIARANVQQAFVFDTVRYFYKPGAKVLCVGCHEDTAFDALQKLGIPIEGIDPVNDYDLDAFYHLETTAKASYDIIFSTSVIEHVANDDLFLAQIQDLLAPNGIGILTCDYKDDYQEGDYIFPGNYRFYTQRTLFNKLDRVLTNCDLTDTPMWECPYPDFFFEGVSYTFATLVFKKG